MQNAERHSQAREVSVSVDVDKDVIRLTVSDDGVGVDPLEIERALLNRTHFGLRQIKRRAEDAGGSARFTSSVEGGFHGGGRAATRVSATTRIRFCVADDHIVIHDGLRAMADRTEDLEYAGGAADVASLRLLLDRVHPDLLVLDLRFGCVDGFAVCRDVLREHDTLKVMFFSASGDVELLREGVASGGSGYLLKDASRPRSRQRYVR